MKLKSSYPFFQGPCNPASFSIGHNVVTAIQDIAKASVKGRELFGKFSRTADDCKLPPG